MLDRGWDRLTSFLRALEPPRALAISAAAVFAAATVARSGEIPNAAFWKPGTAAMWVLLATGAISGISAVTNAVRLSRRNRRSTLYEACVQLAAYIDDECPGLELKDVGVHVWRVGGPFFARRLRRTQQFLLRRRQPSHVAFTHGKGVIGMVWASRTNAIRNLELVHARVQAQSDFEALSDDDRLGLAWDEYRRTR